MSLFVDRLREPSHNVFLNFPNPLNAIFHPKSVAVVGASEKTGSVGRTILWNLLSSPFGGTLYPVNPKRDNVLGIKAYASLREIPEAIDLVVIVTPAPTVPAIIQEAADLRVKGAIVISAGFKEVGPEGVALEQEILRIAQPAGMRIIGPNCLGVMNTASGVNATFAAAMANPGHVAFISQSGALCTAVLDWSFTNNVGFSVFASIGSMLDVDWGDLIYYLGDDPNTKSIVIYMESIGNARSFLSAAREVALEKPIILIKPGRTESASKAAASHTGSLTGSDEVLDAAFRRCGVLRVNTIEELFSMAEVLDKQPLPKGPRMTIITNAGGPGVIATDALISSGGELAPVPDATLEKLNGILPAAWSHNNPIDVLGDASPQRYAETLQIVNEEQDSDGTLVILTPQAMTQPNDTAKALTSSLRKNTDKPVLASWMGGADVLAGRSVLNRADIPTFEYPDTAARAFSLMWSYSKNLQSIYETPDWRDVDSIANIDSEELDRRLNTIRDTGRTILTELEAKELLGLYGIPITRTVVAHSVQEAVTAAEAMGYPVVLKLHSETITHKSDVGGVQLNLHTSVAVEKAYQTIQDNLKERGLLDAFEGVTVQPMISKKGTELLLGCTYDPQFGPVIAFGAGGVYVELFKDVAFGLPPLNSTLVKRLIERTKISKALEGFRGEGPVNQEQLEATLIRFSYLITRHPLIKEIEINPLLASSSGVIALDARVVLHEPDVALHEIQPNVIREYPYQYMERWQSPKGQSFVVRPIRASDETLMVQFHQTLSEQSVYHTFNHQFPLDERITHHRLSRVCTNDYDREISLVCVTEEAERIAGIVRLTKLHNTEKVARFRLLVSDDYQRQGIGKKLLTNVIEVARQEGLREVMGYVLASNEPMKTLCQELGFMLEPTDNGEAFIPRLLLQPEPALSTV